MSGPGVDIRNVHEVEESAHVVIVPDLAGEDALGENGRRQDEIVRLLAKHTQACSTLHVERSNPLDAACVEYDDQPALWVRRPTVADFPVGARRGRTSAAESNHCRAF